MGEGKTSAKVNTQANPDGDGRSDGPPGPPSGWAHRVKRVVVLVVEKARGVNGWLVVRGAVLLLGLAAVIAGLVLWLNPAGPTKASANENTTTTVIDDAGRTSTTKVQKSTETKTPGVGKSDAMLVAVFTVGVGLLAVGLLWQRIQEIGFGNVLSVKLTEASVQEQDIPLAAATMQDSLSTLDSTRPGDIAKEVRKLSQKPDLVLARVDLRDGEWWVPTYLCFYMLLLADYSKVKQLIFTWEDDGQPETYLGAAPVEWLADKVKLRDPVLFAAYEETVNAPVMTSPATGATAMTSEGGAFGLGTTFSSNLQARDKTRKQGDPILERVSPNWLFEFADDALIKQCIQSDVGQALSKQEQLGILAFPLRFVPITNRHRKLIAVLDRRRIAENMGFPVVDL
jgi:hypothetical protein